MKKLLLLFIPIILLGAGCSKQSQPNIELPVTTSISGLSQDKIFEMKQTCLSYKKKAEDLKNTDLRHDLNGQTTTDHYLADYAHVAYSPVLNTCVAYYEYVLFDIVDYGCKVDSVGIFRMYDLLADKEIDHGSTTTLIDQKQRNGSCPMRNNSKNNYEDEYYRLIKEYQLE